MLKNTSNSFGSVAKVFHWLMALMIIGMFIVGFVMSSMPSSSMKFALYGMHKATGFVLFILVVLRLSWRFINPVPRLPTSLHSVHYKLAKLSPLALYIMIFLMTLSGYIMSNAAGYPISVYGLFTVPNIIPKSPNLSKIASTIHVYSAFLFIAILTLHVSAALYHHFILKTNILLRMLPAWFPNQLSKRLGEE